MQSHAGLSFPLGASGVPGGINFRVFSRHATRIELLLSDSVGQAQPTREIELDPRGHRSYYSACCHRFDPVRR